MAGARARLLADAAALARPRRRGGGAEPGARSARYGRGRSAHLVSGEVGGDAVEEKVSNFGKKSNFATDLGKKSKYVADVKEKV